MILARMNSHDYRENWRRYKQIRNLFWGLWVGIFPSMFAILLAYGNGFTLGLVCAVFWFALFMYVGNRVSRWPCPRCGKVFAGKGWYNKGFAARTCEHCGLPKYAQFDPRGEATEHNDENSTIAAGLLRSRSRILKGWARVEATGAAHK
jgi:hypothetical protein